MEASTSRNAGGAAAEGRAGVLAKGLSVLIFVGLVAVVPLSSVPYGSVEPLWTALFEAAVFLFAALWALEGALSGRWVARAHVLALPGLALAAYALLQSLDLGGGAVSYDPYETRLVALLLFAYTTYLALLLRYTETERRLRALLYAVVAAGLASALFGIVRQTAQRGGEGFLLEYLRPGGGYAQFINKNHFAYLAEMALGVLLGLVAGRGVGRAKALVPLALALPLWAGLVLSNSRGGILAMLCQVIFLGASFGVTRERGTSSAKGFGPKPSALDRVAGSKAARAGLVLALLVTIVVGMAWLGGDTVADRVASVGEEVTNEATDATRSGRKDIWAATWASFAAHPLAGVGFGGYWVAVSERHEGSGGLVPQQAHNDYLEVLASGGVVGAAVVLLFLLLLVRQSSARLRAGSAFARAACLGALTGLCGVAVHSLVEFGLHVPSNAFAALALAAAAAAQPLKLPKN